MSDLISRQAVIEELAHIMCDHPLRGYEDEQLLINAVESFPSADRPTGEINAIAIYEKAKYEVDHNKITLGEFEERIEPLRHMPSADRPKGHIVTNGSGKYPTVWAECSECGKPIDAWDKFCRHCGADMRGEKE